MSIGQVLFPAVNEVAFRQSERDFELGPTDVLLETEYSAISAGTELAKLTGLQTVAYPHLPGSRAVGRVLNLGPQVQGFAVGDRVFSHTPHAARTLANRFCVPVPDELDGPSAALLGLALVAFTAVRQARPELGDRAVVLGLGVVGIFCAQLLQLSGAEVIGVDRIEQRLEIARRCGIEHTVHAEQADVREAVLELTGGAGAEYVVECTGVPALAETAVRLAARQGEVILLGSPRGEYRTDVTPLLSAIHLWRPHGSLTVKGAHEWRYPLYADGFAKHSMERNAAIVCRLMLEGRLRTRELITHVLPPENAPEAYAGLQHHPEQYLGVVFDWKDGKEDRGP